MNTAVSLSSDLARRAIGTRWHLDADRGTVREHLGTGRPPLHFGEVYETPAKAMAVHPDKGFEPLTGRVRLPRRTPMAVPSGRELENAVAAAWLVISADLFSRGLRLEMRRIASVDYMAAPEWLSGIADWVAHTAMLEGEPAYRVRVGHDRSGVPVPLDVPDRQTSWGWAEDRDAAVFFSREEAERHADRLSDQLLDAADWRARCA